MKTEILIWNDKNWNEIPKQDNPAFDYKYENERLQQGLIGRRIPCIIICKKHIQSIMDGFIVIEVPPQGDVIQRGLFWTISDAELFAKSITPN